MMPEKIKVIIADDHELIRDGLKLLFNGDEQIQLIGEAVNGKELIELAAKQIPDVILTDLIMPVKDGVEAIKELFSRGIKRIIALSTFDSERLIVDALEAGAIGYILKNAQRGEIVEAIIKVYNFKPYYCSSTTQPGWRDEFQKARLILIPNRTGTYFLKRKNKLSATSAKKNPARK